MKIFVTGGTGFVGRRLVDRLSKDKNNQIFCLTRDLSKAVKSTEENVEYVEGDLCNFEQIKELLKDMDQIYHLAAFISYGNIDKKKMSEINISGTENILHASKKNGVKKTVCISTAGIYHPTNNKIVNEKTSLSKKHVTHYTKTKTASYEITKRYIKENNLNAVVVLPTSVYGNGSPLFESLINSIKIEKTQFIPSSQCKLSLVHADDLCEGIELAMSKGVGGEDYIFSGETMSLEDITKKIASILNKKIKIIKISDVILAQILNIKFFVDKFIFNTNKLSKSLEKYNKEIYKFVSGNLVASDQKARTELGWQPKISIDNGFKEMVLE